MNPVTAQAIQRLRQGAPDGATNPALLLGRIATGLFDALQKIEVQVGGGINALIGSTPPAHQFEETGKPGQFRYDAANQVMYARVFNDTARQMFTVDLSGSMAAGLLNEDVLLFDVATHTWTTGNLLFEEYTLDGETWDVDVNFKDDVAGTIDTALSGTNIIDTLESLLPGCTITVNTSLATWIADVSGLVDGDGLVLVSLDVYKNGTVVYATLGVGDDLVAELSALLPGYTVEIQVTTLVITQDAVGLETGPLLENTSDYLLGLGPTSIPAMTVTVDADQAPAFSVNINGPAGTYPAAGSAWFKTFADNAAALSEMDLTPLAAIGTLDSGDDPETEIPSVLGTVEGGATTTLETDTDQWGIVQAVGDPRSEYPQIMGGDEIRLLVGNDTKTAVVPSAAVYPLPQWVGWAVFNIFP